MQLGLSYSLRKLLEDHTDVQAFIHYDGIQLPKGESFYLIKPRSNQYTELSKSRETVTTTYRFELEVSAMSLAERTRIQDLTDSIFLFEKMPLYDDGGNRTNREVAIDVVNVVPIFPEEISSESGIHNLYFNLEIPINRHKLRRK